MLLLCGPFDDIRPWWKRNRNDRRKKEMYVAKLQLRDLSSKRTEGIKRHIERLERRQARIPLKLERIVLFSHH